jgi:hypothetical protein
MKSGGYSVDRVIPKRFVIEGIMIMKSCDYDDIIMLTMLMHHHIQQRINLIAIIATDIDELTITRSGDISSFHLYTWIEIEGEITNDGILRIVS